MRPTEMQPTIHLQSKPGYFLRPYPDLLVNVLWVAFSLPPGSLSLVKCPVYE
jgi:hypothetical protein